MKKFSLIVIIGLAFWLILDINWIFVELKYNNERNSPFFGSEIPTILVRLMSLTAPISQIIFFVALYRKQKE
jgi:hypothetical protein